MDVLFFSRGRGRGHAIPDMAIMEAVHRLDPNIEWRFVSYGTGAATLSEFGQQVHDLELPDDNPFLETLIRACGAIRTFEPRVVVSHEEFAALPAAKICGAPAIFLVDWFMNEQRLATQTLAYAESVIFPGERGAFDEPPFLKGKIDYVGSFVRGFRYHKQDRERARRELGLGTDATVVSVFPGTWASEQRAPAFDLLVSAFHALDCGEKSLCWVAGSDFERLLSLTQGVADVLILRNLWPTEQLMVASDLVVTKGNRGTIIEVSELGIASISLSSGQNPIDDYLVARIKTNLPLRIKGLTSEFLARCMQEKLEHGTCEFAPRTPGVTLVAEALTRRVRSFVPAAAGVVQCPGEEAQGLA